jgi:hypothetical protein
MIKCLIQEIKAIAWYEQRLSLELNEEARAIMANAQKEEFKRFGMNLEFLLRRDKDSGLNFRAFCSRKAISLKLRRKQKRRSPR